MKRITHQQIPLFERVIVATKFILPAIVAVAAFLVTAERVNAVPVYIQITPDEPLGAFSSLNLPGFQKIADNFVLTGNDPITVRSIRFIGGATGTSTPVPLDDFRVVFLQDVAGNPGPPVPGGDLLIGPAFQRTLTGGRLLNGVTLPTEYLINFDDGIVLNPNTEYWVSISNDLLPNNGWVWARANGEFDQVAAATFGDVTSGPWNLDTNEGMFFEINDHLVPEPSSIGILFISLAAISLSRWQMCLSSRNSKGF